MPTQNVKKIAALCCMYDDFTWFHLVFPVVYSVCDAIYFSVNQIPWSGPARDVGRTLQTLRSLPDPENKILIVHDTWHSEIDQRNWGFALLQLDGFDYMFIVDGDEIYDKQALRSMFNYATGLPEVGCWHTRWYTYWKTPEFRIDPVEPYDPPILVRTGSGGFLETRNIKTERHELIPPEIGMCHHMSYARTDEDMLKKLAAFSHADQIIPGWFETVWKGWDSNHNLENLHPVTPEYYRRTVEQPRNRLPPSLQDYVERCGL